MKLSSLTDAELQVYLTLDQIEQLLTEPGLELIVQYPYGVQVVIRVTTSELEENETVH